MDENPLGSAQVVPVNFVPLEWTSLHELLFAGAVDFIARKPTSLWSNRLVLPNIDVIDHAKLDTETKIAALPHTISLRGRRLEGAVLLGARLRKADFTGANLRGADIRGRADLREANFGCEDTGAGTQCADLRGANLLAAQLQGADLDEAQLQGASLENAELQGADLGGAQLQGASLDHAQLQGASLDYARLDGASLRPTGKSWVFRDHRTMAEVIAEEAA